MVNRENQQYAFLVECPRCRNQRCIEKRTGCHLAVLIFFVMPLVIRGAQLFFGSLGICPEMTEAMVIIVFGIALFGGIRVILHNPEYECTDCGLRFREDR